VALGAVIRIIDDPILVRVLPRENARSRRRAKRQRHEIILKHRPFTGETIDVRRLDDRTPGTGQRIPPLVIAPLWLTAEVASRLAIHPYLAGAIACGAIGLVPAAILLAHARARGA